MTPFIYAPPPPPEEAQWTDVLKWVVSAMDIADPDLSFTASLLHHAIDRGGLTERQARYADKICARVAHLYSIGVLECQTVPAGDAEIEAASA